MRASIPQLAVGLYVALGCCGPPAASIILWGGHDCTATFTEEATAVCHFPSRGPNGNIHECQSSQGGLWCPISADYCSDGRFRWCPGTDVTFGGTDPGRLCHFPFVYKGVEHRHCTRSDTHGENYLWCSTTGNYTGKWTHCKELSHLMPCQFSQRGSGMDRQCVFQSRQWQCRTATGQRRVCDETDTTEGGNDPGRPCSFPFKHNGVRHSECQRHKEDGDDYMWCGTTGNFDRDRLWTLCKQRTEFRLQGLLLLLVVVAGAVLGACALAYFLHCLCEHACPLFRRCGRRRCDGSCPVGTSSEEADAAADANAEIEAGAGPDGVGKHARLLLTPVARLTPTAPPPPPPSPPPMPQPPLPPSYHDAVLRPSLVVMAAPEAFK